jgi:SAM-dependent methyltransferase
VVGVDFNPAHIAIARRLAADADLHNITFIEADLATLASDAAAAAIPEADVVSMHGVWSWVPETAKAGIVRLLRDKVRPGGIVHVSYNALPGWQNSFAIQRVVRQAGLRLAGRSDRQAAAGFEVVRQLRTAGATALTGPGKVGELLDKVAEAPAEYLAHEFMNAAWAPCWHGDVAEALAGAKLEWVASARLPENFPELMMDEAQRAVHDRFDDPMMRELIKDSCTQRSLRHDVFVRGARRIDGNARSAALRQLTLALTVPPDDFKYEIEMPAGKASLGEAFYRPVVRALAERPRRVAELLDLPEIAGRRDNPAEIVGMLVGTEQACIVSRPKVGMDGRARRFNAVAARRQVRLDKFSRPTAVAAPSLGAGFVCPVGGMFLIERITEAGGVIDPSAWATELVPDPEPAAGLRERLTAQFAKTIESRLPVWRAAGIV